MNETIDRLIAERQALDRGFPNGVVLSGVLHVGLAVTVIVVPMLLPKPPIIRVVTGTIVALPPGGRGSPLAAPPAPAAPKAEPQHKSEAPKIDRKPVKPPKEEHSKAVVPFDAKKNRKPPKKTPTPPRAAAAGGTSGGTGKSLETPGIGVGLELGPGVPGGTDPNGDWYLAGVQRKIWSIWTQQIHTGMSQSVTVRFTILADGSVDGTPEIVQSSGVYLLDTAAQRAVMTAGPFSSLPKTYETNRLTIQAVFKPTS